MKTTLLRSRVSTEPFFSLIPSILFSEPRRLPSSRIPAVSKATQARPVIIRGQNRAANTENLQTLADSTFSTENLQTLADSTFSTENLQTLADSTITTPPTQFRYASERGVSISYGKSCGWLRRDGVSNNRSFPEVGLRNFSLHFVTIFVWED
jgi:hypothetical protein